MPVTIHMFDLLVKAFRKSIENPQYRNVTCIFLDSSGPFSGRVTANSLTNNQRSIPVLKVIQINVSGKSFDE